MEITSILALVAGLVMLAVGADLLVAGAISLARRWGVPLLVIGLTVVAWGTSAPELVVSVEASLTGHPGVSIGNLVGSNIANLMLIGGICTTLMALGLSRSEFRRDGVVLLLATLLFIGLFLDGQLSVWKGVIMLVAVFGYSLWMTLDCLGCGRLPDELQEPLLPRFGAFWRVAVGGVMLAYGGKFLIDGAVSFADYLQVSEAVIGMTVVAVGTSLPELAASLAAVRRKQSDIVLGNLIGSNIYNILAIMGVVSLISGNQAMPAGVVDRDMWVMGATTGITLALLLVLQKLPRWTGPGMLVIYFGFLVLQVQGA